ncbi:uncharacterized protein LOC133816399 isoform X1 [Humulus lupulus]|uniref:uncharacterized protein LOC133816399 isoform X1 n=1 Tax=Humulus lupulus TaxID=3486 RepID=UPI002B412A12|nr:uncharacterized protein LOC133816399 isoform X1 [Humulus lupulus]XP_062104905.1 uncharacterized protein LOC133816399 isoform X1 [Humulus lupulus]
MRCWWIPTLLSSKGRRWLEWCGEMQDCEKAFAPILTKRHWFLAILKLAKKEVEVYNNFKIPSTSFGLAIMETMLQSMDEAFTEQVKKVRWTDFTFRGVSIEEPVTHKKECVEYDCGVYVMKMLLQEYVPGVLTKGENDAIDELHIGKCILTGPTNVPTELGRQLIAGRILTSSIN